MSRVDGDVLGCNDTRFWAARMSAARCSVEIAAPSSIGRCSDLLLISHIIRSFPMLSCPDRIFCSCSELHQRLAKSGHPTTIIRPTVRPGNMALSTWHRLGKGALNCNLISHVNPCSIDYDRMCSARSPFTLRLRRCQCNKLAAGVDLKRPMM
ncbi:hypothetical protein BDV97DRAFT_219029 [Delphinella strobiligena]|nr:hypothetical protein BDV97DRAFT_219029 [Delphinella strobiligena]